VTELELPADRVGAFVGPPALLAPGAVGGPLSGTRLVVKDVFDVAGQVTGAGNPTFAAQRAPAAVHASAVQRLVEAGASVVGRTVSDELAYSLAGVNVHHGTPRNVAAPGRVAGGSSSGSAAAVAAGEAELGLGTDTGGSIRVPASYCGLFGWRPTHGAVDVTGVVALSPSFDTVGLLSRDLHLLRVAADALLGTGAGAPGPVAHLERVRSWSDALAVVDEPVQRGVDEGLGLLLDGRVAPPVELGLDLAAGADAFRALQGREAWEVHGAWIGAERPAMAPDIAERFAVASRVSDDDVAAARAVRAEWRLRLSEVLADGTVLVMPAASGPAPAVDADLAEARASTLRLTAPAGLAGLPVVVVPGAHVQGFPLGVAFVGGAGRDRELLALAGQLSSPSPPSPRR